MTIQFDSFGRSALGDFAESALHDRLTQIGMGPVTVIGYVRENVYDNNDDGLPFGRTALTNIALDISALEQCQAVFCGLIGSCSVNWSDNARIYFLPNDHPTVRSWVRRGGRLCCVINYAADPEFGTCFASRDHLAVANLMTAIGSTMLPVPGNMDSQNIEPFNGILGSARIGQIPYSLSGLKHGGSAGVSGVSGGTAVSVTNGSGSDTRQMAWTAVERIGAGAVMLTNTDAFDLVYPENTEFARRFIENDIDNLV